MWMIKMYIISKYHKVFQNIPWKAQDKMFFQNIPWKALDKMDFQNIPWKSLDKMDLVPNYTSKSTG